MATVSQFSRHLAGVLPPWLAWGEGSCSCTYTFPFRVRHCRQSNAPGYTKMICLLCSWLLPILAQLNARYAIPTEFDPRYFPVPRRHGAARTTTPVLAYPTRRNKAKSRMQNLLLLSRSPSAASVTQWVVPGLHGICRKPPDTTAPAEFDREIAT